MSTETIRAYDQRGFDYITRDQYGYNYAINNQLFNTKDRGSFQRLILKKQLLMTITQLRSQVHLHILEIRMFILFLK